MSTGKNIRAIIAGDMDIEILKLMLIINSTPQMLRSNYRNLQFLIKLSNFIHFITWWLHGKEDPIVFLV